MKIFAVIAAVIASIGVASAGVRRPLGLVAGLHERLPDRELVL